MTCIGVGLLLLECTACKPRIPPAEANSKLEPQDAGGWNKLAEAELQQLARTGDFAHLTQAANAVHRSLQIQPAARNRGALAMRIRVEMASHRFEEAKRSAEQLCDLWPDHTFPRQCLGDALFQLGEYREAERIWSEVFAQDGPGLATEARFAQLHLVRGEGKQAREGYLRALQFAENGGPGMQETVGSCHLWLGEMAFRSGQWDEAETHYAAARVIMPDDFSVLEHFAELLGARGRIREAAEIYTRLIHQTNRPELMQALGDLYAFTTPPDEKSRQQNSELTRLWHDRAEVAYRASVDRGEVGYFHHLAGFYCDSRSQPEKAVEWARRDLALRRTISAYDALAWALCKAGRIEEARVAIDQALATGTRDAHILYHAAMIRMSANDIAGGRETLQRTVEANPSYNTFHVHR